MNQPILLLEERHRMIRERLDTEGRVLATDLARDLGISEDTIRRDLRELAALGMCKRVYGGALRLSPASGSLRDRQTQNVDAKSALAAEAVKLVRPGQVVFMDSGSTNLAISRALPDDAGLVVVTNTPAIAMALSGRPGFEVVLVGGRMDAEASAALGAQAIRDIRSVAADLCFLGACAVDVRHGVRAFGFEDAAFKRALVELSRVVVVAATTDKLGTSAPFEVMATADVDDLVVEVDAPADVLAQLAAAGPRIHRASS